MIILNVVLSSLAPAAVYGLTWFIVTARDPGAAVDARRQRPTHDELRPAA